MAIAVTLLFFGAVQIDARDAGHLIPWLMLAAFFVAVCRNETTAGRAQNKPMLGVSEPRTVSLSEGANPLAGSASTLTQAAVSRPAADPGPTLPGPGEELREGIDLVVVTSTGECLRCLRRSSTLAALQGGAGGFSAALQTATGASET